MARYIVIWASGGGHIRSQYVTANWNRAVRIARMCLHDYARVEHARVGLSSQSYVSYGNKQIDEWTRPKKPSHDACAKVQLGESKISLFCTAIGRKPRQPKPIPAGQSYKASIGVKELHKFKSRWPCHGLPDQLARCVFHFGPNGNLLYCEYKDRQSRVIDWRVMETVDDVAMRSLCDAAQRKVHPQHANQRGI